MKASKEIIVVDERVRDLFINQSERPSVGLLIGSYSENSEYCVIHLAQTLDEEEREALGLGQGDQDETELDGRPGKEEIIGKSFTIISPKTIAYHAKQVIRMLPGGLFVLGIYVIEPVETIFISQYEATIKTLIMALSKGLNRNPFYASDFGDKSNKIIFHFSPVSRKFICKGIEPENLKTKPIETTFDRLEWGRLESEYDTISVMHLSDSLVPLKNNLQILMNSFEKTLQGAKFFIEGRKPSYDELFVEAVAHRVEHENGISDLEDEERGNSSDPNLSSACDNDEDSDTSKEKGDRPISPVHILIDRVPGLLGRNSNKEDFLSHMHIQGKIAAVAFVPVGRSSTAYAVNMLRQDILRSMASRLEMHCESLIDEGANGLDEAGTGDTPRIYHEIPRRVFANLPGSKVLLSDYLFPGEGPKDSVATFREILSLYLEDETEVIMNKEKPFDLGDIQTRGSMEELLCHSDSSGRLGSHLAKSRLLFWTVIFGAFVALFAVFTPFFFKTTMKDGEDIEFEDL